MKRRLHEAPLAEMDGALARQKAIADNLPQLLVSAGLFGVVAPVLDEHVINVILEDFVAACDPLHVDIEGDFHVRGNIKTIVRASYRKS